MNDSSYLYNYLVKVNDGSGIYFKPSEDSSSRYLITANHVLDDVWPASALVMHKGKKRFEIKNPKSYCIFQSPDDKADLVVFKFDKNTQVDLPNDVYSLDIYHGDFKKSLIAGYPSSKSGTSDKSQIFKFGPLELCNPFENTETEYRFKIESETVITSDYLSDIDSLKGCSGGGVFVLGADGKFHLAGVVIEAAHYSNVIYTSIGVLLSDINSQVDAGVLLSYQNQFFDSYDIDPNQDKLYEIKDRISNSGTGLFTNFSTFNEQDFINQALITARGKSQKLKIENKKISEFYLYAGLHYHLNGVHANATKYLKKAIDFDAGNITIFEKALYDRKSKKASELLSKNNEDVIEKIKNNNDGDNEQLLIIAEESIRHEARRSLEEKDYNKDIEESYSKQKKLLSTCEVYLSSKHENSIVEAFYLQYIAYKAMKWDEKETESARKTVDTFIINHNNEYCFYALYCCLHLIHDGSEEVSLFSKVAQYWSYNLDESNTFYQLYQEAIDIDLTNQYQEGTLLEAKQVESAYAKALTQIEKHKELSQSDELQMQKLSEHWANFRSYCDEWISKIQTKYSTYNKASLVELLNDKDVEIAELKMKHKHQKQPDPQKQVKANIIENLFLSIRRLLFKRKAV